MSIKKEKQLKRFHVAELPLLRAVCEKIGLRDILNVQKSILNFLSTNEKDYWIGVTVKD